MLKFNVPPYIGTELEFITSAIQNHKICGDGPFTQKCNQWLKESTGVEKVLLTTSCTHALEMSAVLSEIRKVTKLSCLPIPLSPLQTPLS